jgi:NDP-sugar pyrophosphorylase family protein
MQAIVLAAGEGSRMWPLTSLRPKVMLPVGGRPFIEHVVHRARDAGVTELIFVVGYGSEAIKNKPKEGDDFRTKVKYAFQKERLGTGQALMTAADMAENRFLVLNGDVLTDVTSLKRMMEVEGLAVAAKRVSEPSRYGVLET